MAKRTLENCSLIKMYGSPEQTDGKCNGLAKSRHDDEPCDVCKACKLHTWHDT